MHVSGCISGPHIDLNPVNIWAMKKHYGICECALYILPIAILNTKTQSRSILSYIVHSLKYDLCDVENVCAIRSGNKCDVLSDVWFCFFFDHDLNNLHGIIIPSYFTSTIRWNSRAEKNAFWTYLLCVLLCEWNSTTHKFFLVQYASISSFVWLLKWQE